MFREEEMLLEFPGLKRKFTTGFIVLFSEVPWKKDFFPFPNFWNISPSLVPPAHNKKVEIAFLSEIQSFDDLHEKGSSLCSLSRLFIGLLLRETRP